MGERGRGGRGEGTEKGKEMGQGKEGERPEECRGKEGNEKRNSALERVADAEESRK